MKEEYEIIIVGAGPGGITCLDYLYDRLGRTNILLLESNDKIGGRLNFYDNIFGMGSRAFNKTSDYIKSLNVIADSYISKDKLILNEKVLSVKKSKKNEFKILISNNQVLKANIVVLATGTSPLIDEIKQLGDVTLLTYKDYPFSKIVKGNNIAVIGGGHTAFEITEYLINNKEGISIQIFEREAVSVNCARKQIIDCYDNVKIKEKILIESMTNKNSDIEISFYQKGDSKKTFNWVIVAIGERANTQFMSTDLIENISLFDLDGKLKVSEFENSNTLNMSKYCEGLFGIGDVVNRPLGGYILHSESEAIRTAVAIDNLLKKLI